jgi:hypothetical protein
MQNEQNEEVRDFEKDSKALLIRLLLLRKVS